MSGIVCWSQDVDAVAELHAYKRAFEDARPEGDVAFGRGATRRFELRSSGTFHAWLLRTPRLRVLIDSLRPTQLYDRLVSGFVLADDVHVIPSRGVDDFEAELLAAFDDGTCEHVVRLVAIRPEPNAGAPDVVRVTRWRVRETGVVGIGES